MKKFGKTKGVTATYKPKVKPEACKTQKALQHAQVLMEDETKCSEALNELEDDIKPNAVNMLVQFEEHLYKITDEKIDDYVESLIHLNDAEKEEVRKYYKIISETWEDHAVSAVEQEKSDDSTVDSIKADPLQMHLHSPSEHTIDSKSFDVEVHFVNTFLENMAEPDAANQDFDKLLVVGVMFDRAAGGNQENLLLKKWIDLYEANNNTSYMDLSEFAPDTNQFYHYKGSLTTPPCSEIVEWFVLKEVQTISDAQLEKIQEYTHSWSDPKKKEKDDEGGEPDERRMLADAKKPGNNRETQFKNSRNVFVTYSEGGADGASTIISGAASLLALATVFAF